jgi:RNA polymerase sigma factor for flagellar operon FliA
MSSVAVSTALDREQLILSHLPQVRLLATRLHQRCPKQVELCDLESAGVLGLINAVDRFQPERGYKLKTFAEHRIRGAMLDYLRKLDPLPRAVRRFVRRRDEASASFERQWGRAPEPAELAQALGLSIDRYRRLECTARAAQTVSLETLPHGVV